MITKDCEKIKRDRNGDEDGNKGEREREDVKMGTEKKTDMDWHTVEWNKRNCCCVTMYLFMLVA